MKRSHLGTSIVEVLVLIIILTSGILGMYTIYNKSQALSAHTAHKLQATSIMREGLEAVMNIRATNWMNFSADTDNCWNEKEYSAECLSVGDDAALSMERRITEGSYILTIPNVDVPRWKLDKKLDLPELDPDINPNSYYERKDREFNPSYVEAFRIKKMDTGFWEQDFNNTTDYKAPFFTREIQISYDGEWTASGCESAIPQPLCSTSINPQKMRVRSIVKWVDSASSEAHILKSEMVLTNRKK